jgi:integrase
MYLSKNRNGTYYTRISLQKSLRDLGFPFSVRTSLNTKIRSQAIDRNLSTALFIRKLIDENISELAVNTFTTWMQKNIQLFKNNEFHQDNVRLKQVSEGVNIVNPPLNIKIKQGNNEFLKVKQADNISYRSLEQLKLRTKHFMKWSKNIPLNSISPKMVMNYRNYLIEEGRSFKTNHSYMSACSQFFKWCTLVEYIKSNPFENIKLGQKPLKKKYEQRQRWSKEQLHKLFSHIQFRFNESDSEYKYADYWVPLICLFSGMRVSEACQLGTDKILKIDNIYVFDVDSADENTQLKTLNAYRQIPIHSKLISLGFLDFVTSRKVAEEKLLFNEKPLGKYVDWSKRIGGRFVGVFNRIGLAANERPTLYGLRHTFIDELQQQDVNENIVAELVGHSKSNITFGRYGKKVNIQLLKDKIELISPDLVKIKKYIN